MMQWTLPERMTFSYASDEKGGMRSPMDVFNKGEMRSMLQRNMNTNFDTEETQAVILKKYFMLFCDFPMLPQIPFLPKGKIKTKLLEETKQKR